MDPGRKSPAVGRRAIIFVLTLTPVLFLPPHAHAQDASKILKAMSDYVTGQKTLTSSGQVLLNRPDKLRATRTGGYADVELVFDGKTATVLAKHANAFAQADAPGSVDQLIEHLRDRYKVAMPGADLLLARVYDELTAGVVDSKHIGQGVIDGVDCEHLAFRTAQVDWQLWVEIGGRPIPRKYIITSKAVTAAPQYALRIKDWRTDMQVAADAFVFKPPADARKVELTALREIDEVPPGRVEQSDDQYEPNDPAPHAGSRGQFGRSICNRQALAE